MLLGAARYAGTLRLSYSGMSELAGDAGLPARQHDAARHESTLALTQRVINPDCPGCKHGRHVRPCAALGCECRFWDALAWGRRDTWV